MGIWTEDEFVSRAKTLARAHVGTKTPLNDLVEKVAREAELTPDSIRTLGRLTNVATFQEVFQQKASSADPDRMVEFEPGDPEVVIGRIVKAAAVQAAAAPPPSEKQASLLPDLMRAERGFSEPIEKVAAAEEPIEREAPKQLQTLRLRKMASELDIAAKAAAIRWESGVEKLAVAFKKAPGYGPSYVDFEKSALAEYGDRAVAELKALREDLRLPKTVFAATKIAELAEKYASEDTAELRLLGDLIDHREQYAVLRTAQAQVRERLSHD